MSIDPWKGKYPFLFNEWPTVTHRLSSILKQSSSKSGFCFTLFVCLFHKFIQRFEWSENYYQIINRSFIVGSIIFVWVGFCGFGIASCKRHTTTGSLVEPSPVCFPAVVFSLASFCSVWGCVIFSSYQFLFPVCLYSSCRCVSKWKDNFIQVLRHSEQPPHAMVQYISEEDYCSSHALNQKQWQIGVHFEQELFDL